MTRTIRDTAIAAAAVAVIVWGVLALAQPARSETLDCSDWVESD